MNKIIYLLFFFTLTISLAAQSKSKDVLLFEIESFSNPGGGGMGIKRSSKSAYFIYQSGRIACKSLRYNPQGKELKSNNSKCFQTSQTKIKELTEFARKSDFQTADYPYFANGVDWGKSFSITFFNNNGNKKIHLGGGRGNSNTTQIPLSLQMFLQKIGEIDKAMKVENEFLKPNPHNLPHLLD